MKLNGQYLLFQMNVKEFSVEKMLQMVIQQEIFHKLPIEEKKVSFNSKLKRNFILFPTSDQENNNVDQNFLQ